MNSFIKKIVLFFFFSSAGVSAEYVEPLDSALGLGVMGQFAMIAGEQESDKAARYGLVFSMNRLARYFSLDARASTGGEYTDFGGMFRLFKHWSKSELNTSGWSIGLGAGAHWSAGPEIELTTGAKEEVEFVDILVAPFARYLFDFGNGVGASLDFEFQFAPKRMYRNSETFADLVKDDDEKQKRARASVGLTLYFEVN